jgi:hypothetical protein
MLTAPRGNTGQINVQSVILLHRPALYYTPDYTFTVLDTVAHWTVHSQQKHFDPPRFVKSNVKADGSDFSDHRSLLRTDFPEFLWIYSP